MEVDIKVFNPPYDKKEFYEHMGDVFSMNTVRKELPYLSNDPHRLWFLAFSGNTLIGFCSLQEHKNVVKLLCDYVFPQYRGNGVYRQLVDVRTTYAERYNKPIEIICTGDIFSEMYLKRGFVEVKRTKNYRFLRRGVSNAT